MKKLITSIAICITALTLNAQTETPTTNSKHAIGIAAGFTTGYGLAYRYQGNKFGTQFTFAPYKSAEESHLSLGVTFLYKLVSFEKVELFLYQGNHYSSTTNKNQTYDFVNSTQLLAGTTTRYFNNGLGFDIELSLNKHAGLHFMAGYAGYNNFKEINVTGETALFFKF